MLLPSKHKSDKNRRVQNDRQGVCVTFSDRDTIVHESDVRGGRSLVSLPRSVAMLPCGFEVGPDLVDL